MVLVEASEEDFATARPSLRPRCCRTGRPAPERLGHALERRGRIGRRRDGPGQLNAKPETGTTHGASPARLSQMVQPRHRARGGLGLLACVAFVLIEITLRRLGSSLGGTTEITGYVMAVATAWGMGFALMELAHVRIEMLRTRMARWGRVMLDLVAMLAMSGTVVLIAFRAWPVLSRSIANDSRANTVLETPLWIPQSLWFAGWVWFAS
jgi:TRAP-type C4-dicarboxylate transport system permease small subunit